MADARHSCSRSRSLSFALSLSLLACAPPSPMSDGGPADAGALTLALGTGQTTFTPIDEGDTLLLAHGCQGLQHVWIALRATGIAPRGVHLTLSLARADDGVVVSAPLQIALTFTPGPAGAYDELTGLMLVVPVPADALGHPLVVRADIVDRDGRATFATRGVSIAWGTQICGT